MQNTRSLRLATAPAERPTADALADRLPVTACWRLTGVRPDASVDLRPSAWASLLEGLWPHEQIEICHDFSAGYAMTVKLRQSMAARAAGETATALSQALRAAFPAWVFEPADEHDASCAMLHRVTLSPAGVMGWRQAVGGRSPGPAGAAIELPGVGECPAWRLTSPFDESLMQHPWRLTVRFAAGALDAGDFARLREATLQLDHGALRVASHGRRRDAALAEEGLRQRCLQGWRELLAHPGRAYRTDVVVESFRPASQFALRRLMRDLFGTGFDAVARDGGSDAVQGWPVLQSSGLPAFWPADKCLLDAGVRSVAPEPGMLPEGQGAVVGRTAGGRDVLVLDAARASHCLVLGASGAGKSTLLRRLMVKDIERGAGLLFVDPHGPDFDAMLASVPARRADDVVVIDASDPAHAVSINPLPAAGAPAALRRLVTSQVADIIEAQFETPQSTGPMTRSVVQNAIALAMWHPSGGCLADCRRIFLDDDFRDWLLSKCRDDHLRDAWNAFVGSSGDTGYRNWKPYALARFEPFVSSSAMLALLGPPATVDFRSLIEGNAIVLVRLAKGQVLSETQCQLLGSILLQRVRAAAMALGSRPGRQPFHVVVDEFHSFATPDVPNLFRELRKFSVNLTVASQSLDSLRNSRGGDIVDALLANCAVKAFMRLSPRDAVQCDEYFAPEFKAAAVSRLPNREVVLSMPSVGVPPLRFQALQPDPEGPCSDAEALRAHSGAVHGRPWSTLRSWLGERLAIDPDEFPG